MSITTLLTQIAISLLVVTLYHLWVSRAKQATPAPRQPVPMAPVVPAPVVAAPIVPAPVVATPKATLAVEPLQPELLAVISAAIAVVLGRPHRVVSVQHAVALAPEGNAWAMEGRVEHFLSHRVR
ncbi:MAG: hypothetical protein ABSA83_15485 [Verrucomicrobiota bacterium]|jgi:hypothetical protein